jgi:hypothetical protein
VGLACASSGCYSVGYEPAAGLSELAVPVFENQTLRREVEIDLTRKLRRELLEATPIHLADEDPGVPVLRGAVISLQEAVLVSGAAEEVLASSVTVRARFGVYRGRRLVVRCRASPSSTRPWVRTASRPPTKPCATWPS